MLISRPDSTSYYSNELKNVAWENIQFWKIECQSGWCIFPDSVLDGRVQISMQYGRQITAYES